MVVDGIGEATQEVKTIGNISVCGQAHRNYMTAKGAASLSNMSEAVNLVGYCIDLDSIAVLARYREKARLVFMPPKDEKDASDKKTI